MIIEDPEISTNIPRNDGSSKTKAEIIYELFLNTLNDSQIPSDRLLIADKHYHYLVNSGIIIENYRG